jgi:L-2,4-diaminobutyrate decarboxylase
MKTDWLEDYFVGGLGNAEASQRVLADALSRGMRFKSDFDRCVMPKVNLDEQLAQIREPLPRKGTSLDRLLDQFDQLVARGSVNFGNPRFLGFPDSGNSLAALAGHILYGFLNQNLINSRLTAPTATFVEMAVVRWFRELVGFETFSDESDPSNTGGFSVAGGVSANTIAVLLARERAFPGSIVSGMDVTARKPRAFLPAGIGHYSIRAALGWLGLGTACAVEVPIGQDYRMDLVELRRMIARERCTGAPFFLTAYAGDSRTMTVDRLAELRRIADEFGLWFHVDACHGISLCFSQKLRGAVKGIELADSIAIDPHKVLCIPYAASYILVKNPEDLRRVAGTSDLITKQPYSLGRTTPFFGSRAFTSAKVWMAMKHLGIERIGALVERRHELAKRLERALRASADFVVFGEVGISSVVFSPKRQHSAREHHDAWVERIYEQILEDGRFTVHSFSMPDPSNLVGFPGSAVRVLRVAVGNPFTDEGLIDELVDYLREIVRRARTELCYGPQGVVLPT